MRKSCVIFSLIVLLLLGGLIFLYTRYIKVKEDKEIYHENMLNADFKIKELKAKNKENYYQITQLTIKSNELKYVNSELEKDLKNLKSKPKNVKTVTKIHTEYVTKIDTIIITDTIYVNKKVANYQDEYIKLRANVSDEYLTDVQIQVKDSIIWANEVEYKGWWFWRRPIKNIIKIQSKNPYFNLNEVQSFDLDHKKR